MKRTTEQNKQIQDVIDAFKIVNEGTAVLFGNKTERDRAMHLITKYGEEKLMKMIAFLPTYNAKTRHKYYLVRKPSQLVTHLSDVIDLKKSLDAQAKYLLNQSEREKREAEEFERVKKERESTPPTEIRKKFDNIMNIIKTA